MLRFLALAFLFAAPAHADITSKLQSSVQLQVDGAASQATKIGSTYSVSGSNVKITSTGAFGGLNTLSAGTAVGYTGTDVEINTAGAAFQFTESFIEGDAKPTATHVSSGVVGSFPMLGQTTTTSGGVAGSLAGTITSGGVMTITAGGAGTSATGQHVSEITVR